MNPHAAIGPHLTPAGSASLIDKEKAILTSHDAPGKVFIYFPHAILLSFPVTVLAGEYYLDFKVFI